jgi:hypothetical protein
MWLSWSYSSSVFIGLFYTTSSTGCQDRLFDLGGFDIACMIFPAAYRLRSQSAAENKVGMAEEQAALLDSIILLKLPLPLLSAVATNYAELLIVSPHSNNLNCFFILKNLIYQTVLYVGTPGIGSL